MATQATLAALAKLTGLRDGVLARAARAEFADDPARFKQFSVTLDDLLFDYSKQRIDAPVLSALVELAKAAKVEAKREAMFAGEKINTTEKRAVLHTALRNFSGKPVLVDGKDVMPEVIGTREKMLSFAADVREGRVRGALGQPMTDVINIGIGGSDLGPAMATRALAPFAPPQLRSHFVSNVDGADIGDTLRGLDPSRTLFIVSSKTFTTQETMTNAATARAWIAQGRRRSGGRRPFRRRLDPARQGGRSSASSRRGCSASGTGSAAAIRSGRASACRWRSRSGLTASTNFCAAATRSTSTSATAPIEKNIPILMGLLSVWNRNVLGHATHGVIPYDQRLGRFPAYLQQLQMESNGKHVQLDGSPANTATGPVVWGEPGTNGQHAFFQLIHQGTEIIPLDLLVAATPTEADAHHHDLLVANCFAQGQALMRGRTPAEAEALTRKQGASEADATRLAPHKSFSGSRPTSTFLYRALDPRMLGRLIALYEHKVFTEGAVWDINSFDQWGVELGKELASSLAPIVADKATSTAAARPVDRGAGRASARAARDAAASG